MLREVYLIIINKLLILMVHLKKKQILTYLLEITLSLKLKLCLN